MCYTEGKNRKGGTIVYNLLHNLLADRKGGEIFTLFGGWHFFYIALTAAVIAVVLLLQKKKGRNPAEVAEHFINLAFGLYMADLFLMPVAYGEIDIEKLPFHACTAMCVMCFMSHRVEFLKKYRLSFVLLGLISNAVYLVYPAGVMWHAVHPLSYRVIQTLLFHSVMSVYGLLTLIGEYRSLDVRKCYRDLAVVVGMTVWALLGNYTYNGTSEGYDHFFNWFFVVRDPFYAIPASISPFIMPLLNILVFFAVEMLIHLAVWKIRRHQEKSI